MHVFPANCLQISYETECVVVYINYKKANKQKKKKKTDRKKYNLSHFIVTDHSLIHVLKYFFNIYHMPGAVLPTGGYTSK